MNLMRLAVMVAYALLLLAAGPADPAGAGAFSKEAQESALQATVRVGNLTRKTAGTGAVVGQSGPYVYVLTAGHLMDKTDQLEVATFSARSYPKPERVYRAAEVVAHARDKDLAVIRITTSDKMPGLVRVCPPGQLPRDKSFPVLTVGCSNRKVPTCLTDAVSDRKRARRPGVDGAVLYWETADRPDPGRSGGPLVDRHGRLIGVCSGANDGRGYYCHAEEIHQFLRRHGLRWLYEEGAEK
jgi:S1-C subfamily serine protease